MPEKMNYQSFPLPDKVWERDGKKKGSRVTSTWRGAPLRPVDLPTGPRLAWGSRSGASSCSKGVYMGRPGLPRATYASADEGPSLGPPSGLGLRTPKKVIPDWDEKMYSYLKKEPVSFVLEGVVGFNLASAAEIRQLRENLHQAESKYRVEKEELDSHLDNTQALVTQAAEVLEREELKTQTMEEQLATKQKQLQALRDLVDQNTRQLAQARKLVSIKKKKVCVRVCVCVCARAFL